MSTHRDRTASTLLALVVGMTALSLLLLFSQSIINLMNVSYDQEIGGNVLAIGQTPAAMAELEALSTTLPGIDKVDYNVTWQGELVAINGNSDVDGLTDMARENGIADEIAEDDEWDELDADEQASRESDFNTDVGFAVQTFVQRYPLQMADERLDYFVGDGKDVSADTIDILLPFSRVNNWYGLEIGDTLTYQFGREEVTFTISGFQEELTPVNILRMGAEANPATGAVISAESIPDGIQPAPAPLILGVNPAQLDETVDALADVPDSIVFETSIIQSFIVNLLEQVTALPLAVSLLALFASAVIIANTVSLATLERRREIGIMKALGLNSNQVLALLLLENGILGLLGGILGCALGAGLALLTVLSDTTGSTNFPFMTLLWLILLSVAISVIATLVTAWGASRQKPLIVLRYE